MSMNLSKQIFNRLAIFTLYLTIITLPFLVFGENNTIVINEIAWMGTTNSAHDEWIELYNNTSQEINLTGWTLKANDSSPEITLEGTIAAHGYFLLERTDNASVPNITADQIYTGALSNSGENLELYDDQNNLVDSVGCSEEWLAGDNATKQTMERKNPQEPGDSPDNWQNSQDTNGTPKAKNSGALETPSEEESSEEIPSQPTSSSGASAPTNQPPIAQAGSDITALVNQEIIFDASQSSDPNNDKLTFFWNFGDGATGIQEKSTHIYPYPGQYLVSLLVSDGEFSDLDIITVNIYNQSVIISEFLPDPEGSDEENEWIELFNQSDQIANLTGWQLDDQKEDSQPFTFPANSLIAPHQFLILRRPITKLALNNNEDQVRLIYPDGSIAMEISYYNDKKQGFCVAFDGQDYFWTKIPTPGTANIISPVELENKGQDLFSNNPQPVIKQGQEMPEVLARSDFGQSQKFSSFNPPQTLKNNLTQEQFETFASKPNSKSTKQSASLIQSSQSNQTANLILYLSIIISGSLLVSWFLTLIRKRTS
jgi:hypothetical protein